MYEFTGTVTEVCAVQTFSSGFSKRELIVREEQGEWSRNITFNFKKDHISQLDGVGVGDRVAVMFALDGREWTDPRTNKIRHFSDLVGLGVKVLSSCGKIKASATESRAPMQVQEDGDMPF